MAGDQVTTVRDQPRIYVRQAHGGAGVSTLATCIGPAAIECFERQPSGYVLVVCRSHCSGLLRAQQMAQQVDFARSGLAIVADAPGKLPKPLEDLAQLVSGGYRDVYRIPWVEAWRMGEPAVLKSAPGEVRRMVEELHFAAGELLATTERNTDHVRRIG